MAHPDDDITVVVNGSERKVAAGTTVADLLVILGVARGRVAVERNHDVVPRAEHEQTLLTQGDHLEVVAFVGGG